jgi:hypothetical protein
LRYKKVFGDVIQFEMAFFHFYCERYQVLSIYSYKIIIDTGIYHQEVFIMKTLRNFAIAAAILFALAPFMSASADGPLLKQIHFTINSPFALNNGRAVFPAGTYILHQVNQNDSNLFALHQDNLTHSPVAMVRTARIDYRHTNYPGEDTMLLTNDEEATNALPIIAGWNIAGDDGWEIIATVPKKSMITESRSGMSRANYKPKKVHIVMTTSGF